MCVSVNVCVCRNLFNFQVDAETNGRRTYAELCQLIPRASGGLKAAGVRPGDVVLLVTRNHIDFPLAMLAVIHRGAACAPVSPTLRPGDFGTTFVVHSFCHDGFFFINIEFCFILDRKMPWIFSLLLPRLISQCVVKFSLK